jgi:hypothetical protein
MSILRRLKCMIGRHKDEDWEWSFIPGYVNSKQHRVAQYCAHCGKERGEGR